MKFDRVLNDSAEPAWRQYYVNYHRLKKDIKRILAAHVVVDSSGRDVSTTTPGEFEGTDEFLGLLDTELAKVNDFYEERETRLLNRWAIISRAAASGGVHVDESSFTLLTAIENVRLRRKLNRVFRDFYVELRMLMEYVNLNYTAFYKVLKKFDKKTHSNEMKDYLEKVKRSYFYSSSVLKELELKAKVSYANSFCHKNRSEARRCLEPPAHEPDNVHLWWFGFFCGFALSLFAVALAIAAQDAGRLDVDEYHDLFVMMRCLTVFALLIWLWGAVVYVWTRWRINFALIFEVKLESQLTYDKVLLAASAFTAFLMAILTVIAFASVGEDRRGVLTGFRVNQLLLGVVIFLVFTSALVLPAPILHGTTRLYLFDTLVRNVFTPLFAVTFKMFFLADIMSSLALPLVDFIHSLCYVGSGQWIDGDPSETCSDIDYTVAFTVALLVYWIRLGQCLRRYHDSHDPVHLFNTGKYGCAMMTALLSKLYPKSAQWVVFATVTTMYSLYWDFKMDWGLFDGKSKYPCLREHLAYEDHLWMYYFAMVSNACLRILWIFTISPHSFSVYWHHDFVFFFVSCLEVFRRMQWAIFRVENEHLNNCGKFRVVREIPLSLLSLAGVRATTEFYRRPSLRDDTDVESDVESDVRSDTNGSSLHDCSDHGARSSPRVVSASVPDYPWDSGDVRSRASSSGDGDIEMGVELSLLGSSRQDPPQGA
eukprot:Rmarinus@m.8868